MIECVCVRALRWVAALTALVAVPAYADYTVLPGPAPVPPAASIPTETPAGPDHTQARIPTAVAGTTENRLSGENGGARRSATGSTYGAPLPLIRSFEGRTPVFSDDGIAAGPSSVIITNNAAITVRTKTGLLVAEISQTAFWNPVAQPNENRGDVRVLFDAGSSRFFISALGRVCATTPCGEIVHLQ